MIKNKWHLHTLWTSHRDYCESVTSRNIVVSFMSCGVWCKQIKTADPGVIKTLIYQTLMLTPIGQTHFSRMYNFRIHLRLLNSFHSYVEVLNNGKITTTSGALFTAVKVLDALCCVIVKNRGGESFKGDPYTKRKRKNLYNFVSLRLKRLLELVLLILQLMRST